MITNVWPQPFTEVVHILRIISHKIFNKLSYTIISIHILHHRLLYFLSKVHEFPPQPLHYCRREVLLIELLLESVICLKPSMSSYCHMSPNICVSLE
ncbi:hypothetical protein Syun_021262 [Stephania yunnanensis]|uniref:Uncharacterized protein n=1 Tax=Stephania yunnanensis TaxID=152371 RepID=A0AAP0IG29_9MAGN